MTRTLLSNVTLACLLLSFNVSAGEGFVLKAGDGEALANGIVIKASPKTGTDGSILVEQIFQTGGTTGLHMHEQGDELFYVVSGRGTATLQGAEKILGPGDVVFVPKSALHMIRNIDHSDPMTVVFFMATHELADLFRSLHERYVRDPSLPITPEEFAEFEKRTGGARTPR